MKWFNFPFPMFFQWYSRSRLMWSLWVRTSDKINRMITVTDNFYLVIFSKWSLEMWSHQAADNFNNWLETFTVSQCHQIVNYKKLHHVYVEQLETYVHVLQYFSNNQTIMQQRHSAEVCFILSFAIVFNYEPFLPFYQSHHCGPYLTCQRAGPQWQP